MATGENLLSHSACAPPLRDRLASKVDRAHIFSSLFGGEANAIKLDRFTLLERIGGGAMGEVYVAYDPRLERKVAIKLVRRHQEAHEHAEDRLLREAKIMAQVDHDNVIRVYDSGTCNGRVYIAMQYVAGYTLGNWLDARTDLSQPARQRLVIRQFIKAGRGLQAAHEASIVHRDFKPDNVLVGLDEQPRVGDFGLARGIASPLDGNTQPLGVYGDPAHTRRAWLRTDSDGVAGTPRYMSPEQWRGEKPDSRSDQFSFCVALYEALLGRSPFGGGSFAQLKQATMSGQFVEPPRMTELPPPLRRTLERGLQVEPNERFSDMDSLLAELEAWVGRRQRWLSWSLLVALILSTIAIIWSMSGSPDPCASAGTAMDGVWNPERRAEIGQTFSRSGVPGAAQVWNLLAGQLDLYTEEWKRQSAQSCRTHERHEQSDTLFDLRAQCLQDGRDRMARLLDQVSGGEPQVRRAMASLHLATAELPDLGYCQDAEALSRGVTLPTDKQKTNVEAIRDSLAEARTLELFDDLESALRLAEAQLQAAKAIHYKPVYAEAQFQVGRLLSYSPRLLERSDGEELIRLAVNRATGARHDQLVAEALVFLVFQEYHHHDTTERGHRLTDHAFAAIERLHSRPRLLAQVHRGKGMLLAKDGKFEEAQASQLEGLALLELSDQTPWLRAAHLHDMANTMVQLGKNTEARDLYAKAHTLYRKLGETHPEVARVLYDQGVLESRVGPPKKARELFSQALRMREEVLGPSHPDVGAAHLGLANVAQSEGKLAEADESIAAGLAIYRDTLDQADARMTDAYQLAGAVHFRQARYKEAIAEYDRALIGLEQRLGKNHFELGYVLANRAEARVMLCRDEAAKNDIDRAQRLLGDQVLGGDRLMNGFLRGVRGRALLYRTPATAVAELQEALDQFASLDQATAPLERAAVHWALAQGFAIIDRSRSKRAHAQAAQAQKLATRADETGVKLADEISKWLNAEAPHMPVRQCQ